MSKRLPNRVSGLSLLEIILVLALLLVLSGMAVPSLARYWEYFQLDSGTQSLSASLEIGRFNSISKRQTIVFRLNAGVGSYDFFEDRNENGDLDTGERALGAYSLPQHVQFRGQGLLGPPSSPGAPVSDPITFSGDRVVFNRLGKLNGGVGTIYLQNDLGDATAISFNIASRLKIYRWDKSAKVWK